MRIAIVLVFLALAGLVAWWSFGDVAAPPAAPDERPAPSARQDVEDEQVETDAVATVEASIDRTDVDTTESEHGLPPPPDDAHWIDVTVVLRDTDEPVPFAKVMWANENQNERMGELPYAQQQRYQQQYWLPAEEFGYRALADAEGRVRVWCKREHLQIVAKSEGRFGYAAVQVHETKTEHKLEIAPDRTLLVHVTTTDERDATGVLVGIGQLGEKREPGRYGYSNHQSRTDAEGLATFEHVQILQRWRWGSKQGQPVPKWTLQLHQPGFEHEPTTIDAQQLPDEPVELRMGASGHLRVRPLVAGEPHVLPYGMRVWDADERNRGFMAWRNVLMADEHGWVEVRHVGLGKTFEVAAGNWSGKVEGPQNDGETRSHEIELSETRCVMTAKVRSADGEPVREKAIIGEFGPPEHRDQVWGQSDEHGNVVWLMSLPKDGKPRLLEQLAVTWNPKDGAIQRHEVGTVSLPIGVTELGEVALERSVPLLSGRIEADCGSNVRASCSIQHYVVYDDPKRKPRWRNVHRVQVKVADDLTFSAYGELPPDRYRIQVHSDAFAPFDPVEFAPGATDLVLRPRCGHKLAAHTVLPEGMKGNALQMVLKSTGAEESSNWGRLREDVAGQADHDWKGLAPGIYRLEVNLENRQHRNQPLLVIDNVRVPAEGDQPVQVDLLDKLTTLTLNIDVQAELAPSQYYVFPPPTDPDVWHGATAPHGKSVMPVPLGTHEITIVADGYRAKTVPVQGTEVAVTLEPWPRATVAVSGLQGLPEGVSVRMNCTPIDDGPKDQRKYRASWNSGKVADLLHGGRASKTIKDEPIEFAFGTRRMSVTLTASAQKPYRSVKLKGFSPTELASAGSHLITVSPDEVTRVIAELQRIADERAKKKAKSRQR
ncbi:MAG: hypothetical protein ACE37K_09135 [Planctomycetota bacterium]